MAEGGTDTGGTSGVADSAQVYPYEFDPEIRKRSKSIALRFLRLNLTSMIAGALLLLVLLLSGIAEQVSLALRGIYWPLSVLIYIPAFIALFFLIELYFSFRRFSLRKETGITTQSVSGWLEDQVKGISISLVISTAGTEFLFAIMQLEKDYWWIVAATAYVIVSISYSTLFPLLFARFFYRIKPLQEGDTRNRLRKLLERVGLGRLEIFTLNESSRSSSANAFVTGIGKGKKVVVFDNLLRKFAPAEVDSIVAHELGHYLKRDTAASMVINVAMAYFLAYMLYLTLGIIERMRIVYSSADPSAVLWFALVLGLVEFALAPLMNLYSRSRESEADRFSLNLTTDPVAFISGEKRLCDINMIEESVPVIRKILFATHPSTLERIQMGERWKPDGK